MLSIVVDRTGVLPTLIRNTPVQPRPRQGKELNPSQSIPICLNEIADVGLYIGLKALPDGCPSSRGLGDYEFIFAMSHPWIGIAVSETREGKTWHRWILQNESHVTYVRLCDLAEATKSVVKPADLGEGAIVSFGVNVGEICEDSIQLRIALVTKFSVGGLL